MGWGKLLMRERLCRVQNLSPWCVPGLSTSEDPAASESDGAGAANRGHAAGRPWGSIAGATVVCPDPLVAMLHRQDRGLGKRGGWEPVNLGEAIEMTGEENLLGDTRLSPKSKEPASRHWKSTKEGWHG